MIGKYGGNNPFHELGGETLELQFPVGKLFLQLFLEADKVYFRHFNAEDDRLLWFGHFDHFTHSELFRVAGQRLGGS